MNEVSRKLLQSAVIERIKKKYDVTYIEIAESIGVHSTHIQKVSKCDRLMSEDKFTALCQRWSIDVTDVEKILKLENEQYLQWKTLTMLVKARKVSVEMLACETGISILKFNQVERGKRQFSYEEVEAIAKVFDIDSQIISEGTVALVCELVARELQYIHLEPSVIEAILKYIEMEI